MKKTFDFSDVLITPKKTTLNSRSEVNLETKYLTKHSKNLLLGIPVFSANMTTTGTISIAKALYKKKLFTALHKFMQDDDLIEHFKERNNSFYTLGVSDEEFEKFKKIYRKTLIKKVCLEVANGYMTSFYDKIKILRDYSPDLVIMAGNVCTPEGVESVINSGADIVKCGIGNGCFLPDTPVKTKKGFKPIKDIVLGDFVQTRTKGYHEVSQIHTKLEKKCIYVINGIHCTANHKFYTDIGWESAEHINDLHQLVKIDENNNYNFCKPVIEKYEVKNQIVYDIGVEEHHSYCVGSGFVVHNSFCETRNKAGIGFKQFSVAQECSSAARELNALCCSDGGVKVIADVCKALGAGSHFVMCGGLFMGFDECETEWIEENDTKKMFSYGMSSKFANEKYSDGLKNYRTSEGRESYVFHKGNLEDLIQDICGGLASCCSYTNTKNLEDLHKNCEFTY